MTSSLPEVSHADADSRFGDDDPFLRDSSRAGAEVYLRNREFTRSLPFACDFVGLF